MHVLIKIWCTLEFRTDRKRLWIVLIAFFVFERPKCSPRDWLSNWISFKIIAPEATISVLIAIGKTIGSVPNQCPIRSRLVLNPYFRSLILCSDSYLIHDLNAELVIGGNISTLRKRQCRPPFLFQLIQSINMYIYTTHIHVEFHQSSSNLCSSALLFFNWSSVFYFMFLF